MKIDDMAIHMMALKSAYPHAWPKESSTEALLATWFDSFQHVSTELTGLCRHSTLPQQRREAFPNESVPGFLILSVIRIRAPTPSALSARRF